MYIRYVAFDNPWVLYMVCFQPKQWLYLCGDFDTSAESALCAMVTLGPSFESSFSHLFPTRQKERNNRSESFRKKSSWSERFAMCTEENPLSTECDPIGNWATKWGEIKWQAKQRGSCWLQCGWSLSACTALHTLCTTGPLIQNHWSYWPHACIMLMYAWHHCIYECMQTMALYEHQWYLSICSVYISIQKRVHGSFHMYLHYTGSHSSQVWIVMEVNCVCKCKTANLTVSPCYLAIYVTILGQRSCFSQVFIITLSAWPLSRNSSWSNCGVLRASALFWCMLELNDSDGQQITSVRLPQPTKWVLKHLIRQQCRADDSGRKLEPMVCGTHACPNTELACALPSMSFEVHDGMWLEEPRELGEDEAYRAKQK